MGRQARADGGVEMLQRWIPEVVDPLRAALIEQVNALIERSEPTGQRVIAAITGDAGHGKTTVLRQISTRVERSGRSVVAVHGSVPNSQISYAGIYALLTQTMAAAPWQSRTPALVDALDAGTTLASPLAVAAALERWFNEYSPDRPVVVAIDDADLVDEDSLRVLAYSASRQPLGRLSIVTVATRQVPVIERIGPMRFALDDLDHGDAMGVALGFGVQAIDADRIVKRLGGNPLAVCHSAEAVAGGATWPVHREPIELAPRLVTDLEERLTALESGTIRLLECAAIVGESSLEKLNVWSLQAGCGPVDELIGQAENTGLVQCDAATLRWHRPWIGEGLTARCPTGRRQRTRERWRAASISSPFGGTPDRRACGPMANDNALTDNALSDNGLTNNAWTTLTPAEQRVVVVITGGASTRHAADELCLSDKTVESHLQSVYRKLDVHSRSQLAVRLRLDDLRPNSVVA
jgi:DNA-binding CsgD family transcriptional regulator